MTAPAHVIVGRVRNAHGIRGELVVEPITDAPDAVFASGRRLFAGTMRGDLSPKGETLTVRGARPFKGGWIVAFAEIADRTTAESWRERYFLLPRDELEPPAEGEVYLHELLGMTVEERGRVLGRVKDYYELPQGLVLDVALDAGGTVMVPYTEGVVRTVAAAERRLVVELPPGLLEGGEEA
ncbi:MAG TPA: ribosome maturation factor RimM [Gemmatimonadaceae bacterium]|nr:ribosome maturation factor RimM [Gemmatimonadaceae bacterium]